jgi:hypothetical protein
MFRQVSTEHVRSVAFLDMTTNDNQSEATGFGVSGRLISRREMRDEGESVDLQKGDDS